MSGDINSDGVFDAADYTVWQDNGGDSIDYRTWEDHFGESIASGIRRRVRAVAPRGSFG